MPFPPRTQYRQLGVAERRTLLMCGDTLAVLLAVLFSLSVWVIVDGRGLGLRFILLHSYWFPLLAGLWLLLSSANDFYSLRMYDSLERLVQVELQVLIVYVIIFFFSPRGTLPRLFILYYALSSFLLMSLWRSWWVGRTAAPRRALIIGSGQAAQAISQVLQQEAPLDYEIVGLIADPPDLVSFVQQEAIAEIVLANGGSFSGPMFQAILDCYEQGVSIVPVLALYEQVTGRLPVELVTPQDWSSVLSGENPSFFNPYPILKRGMDLILAVVGLSLLSLLLPLIAALLWIESPGPIFFHQARVGRGGKLFQMIKLRTMVPDAEQDTGPRWAVVDDPRVTRMGRLLRRTRLDELPQLFNVLRGEISLIGPRPERPEFVEALSQTIPFYQARHVVKPGITGWAQVRYHYGNSAEDALIKLQYDLYYIHHQSLPLDVLILLRTIGKMLSLQGM